MNMKTHVSERYAAGAIEVQPSLCCMAAQLLATKPCRSVAESKGAEQNTACGGEGGGYC